MSRNTCIKDATLTHVAEHVRLLMQRRGITSVNELSKRSGITLSALQALVNGTSNPRASTLRALGQFFGVTPRDLVSDLTGTCAGPVTFATPAEVLRYLMEDVCVSERELASLTGVSQKTINNILLGRTSTPTDSSLAQLARFFSVTSEQLLASQPLDSDRSKGETNEHLLPTNRISLVPWSRLHLLPESLADESNEQVRTALVDATLYATRIGDFRAMEPVVRPNDLVVVDYAADLTPGEIFVVQTEAGAIVLGHHVRKQQRDALHFSDSAFVPVPLEKGRYRRLGRVREIRRDD